MHAAVEDEFSRREVCDPVIAARVGEQSKVSFDFLVGAFGLTVGLGVVGCR
jgi:hypothetical protein